MSIKIEKTENNNELKLHRIKNSRTIFAAVNLEIILHCHLHSSQILLHCHAQDLDLRLGLLLYQILFFLQL